jgi:hypothetical protein
MLPRKELAMSDRTPAEISLGGKIPASVVPPLCQAIAAEGVALGWGEARFEPRSADDLREACTLRNGVVVLWLCDEQASLGQFEDLEALLQEHAIAFRRRCDSTGECDPEIVEYRPGLAPAVIPANAADEPVVPVARIRAVETGLTEALELIKRGDRRGVGALRSICKLLRKQLPPEFPPLLPFEIEQPS